MGKEIPQIIADNFKRINLTGHDLRSIANDERTGNNHAEHWKKEAKKQKYNNLPKSRRGD